MISARDTDTSWSPFSALVDGVRIAFASRWFFFMPSGSSWPQKVRRRPSVVVQIDVEVTPVRYARMTNSTGSSLHSRATITVGSGT